MPAGWGWRLSSFFRAWYVFLGLGLLTFVLAAFVGRVPLLISSAIALPHNLPHRMGVNLRGTLESLADRRALRAELSRLEGHSDDLAAENRRLELEIDRLRELLRVRTEQAPGVVTTAPVVGASSGTVLARLELGRGRRDGLSVGMPATVPAGLVGLVIDVGDRRALVRTVIDPEARVGVTVRGKGGSGVAVGEIGGRIRVTRFSVAEPFEVGDIVETSSVGGLFPMGIEVGVIKQVLEEDPNDLRRSFIVQPAVDFATLLEVVLLAPQ